MLWVYPIQDWVGVRGILWATIVIFTLLLLVPLIDRGPERSPRRRIPMMIGAPLVVGAVVALIIYGANETVASHRDVAVSATPVRLSSSGSP